MKVKKAYTLVELLIVIAISTLLLSVGTKVITEGIRQYLSITESSIKQDNFDNCMINIDNLVRSSYILSIEGENDKILITMKLGHGINTTRRKVIHLKGSNLMVTTYSDTNSDITSGNNVLLRDVKSFEVIKKDNLLYYSITTFEGVLRVKCI